jgi:hypothetical protein
MPALAASVSRYAHRSVTDPVEVFAMLREWKNGF